MRVLATKIPVHMPLGWFSEADPEVLCNHTRLREVLWSVMLTLSPKEARVIQLYYLEGYTITEIALLLHVTWQRVYWLRRDALKRMALAKRGNLLHEFY